MSVRSLFLGLALTLGCSPEVQLELLEVSPGDGGEVEPEASTADARPSGDSAIVDAGEPSVRDASGSDGSSDSERNDGGRGPSRNAMVLRYDFAGRGQEVLDRVGNRHGRIVGTSQLEGSGKLVLNGTDSYVDLPARLVSRLSDATIMVWFEYRATDMNSCWHRVFDFGSNTIRDGRMQSVTSIFYTPRVCWGDRQIENPSAFYVELTTPMGRPGGQLPGDVVKPFTPRMVAISMASDPDGMIVRMHFDGVERVRGRAWFRLSNIDDVNDWLGRSQWDQDRLAPMAYDEFRIYDRALTAQEIEQLFQQGPDAP